MYQDINGKTGNRDMQGNDILYGDLRTMANSDDFSFLADGITELPEQPAPPPPTDEELLAEAKESKIGYFGGCAEFASHIPFEAIISMGSFVYDNTTFSKGQILSAVTRINSGWTPPVGWFWRTIDNQEPVTSKEDMIEINNVLTGQAESAWFTNNALKKEVNLCTTVEEVEAITWPWPNNIDPRNDDE